MNFGRHVLFRAARAFVAATLLLLAGCSGDNPLAGTANVLFPGSVANGPLPPPAPGMARLIFFRNVDYQGSSASPVISLNGSPTGRTENGSMFYRDVAPGTYAVTALPSLPFANQFPTVNVKAGDLKYIQIGALTNMGDLAPERAFEDTFIVSVVDPQWGAYEISSLRRIHG